MEHKKGDTVEFSREYNPMKADAVDMEKLIMTTTRVNGDKKLASFIDPKIEKAIKLKSPSGIMKVFTMKVILTQDCTI